MNIKSQLIFYCSWNIIVNIIIILLYLVLFYFQLNWLLILTWWFTLIYVSFFIFIGICIIIYLSLNNQIKNNSLYFKLYKEYPKILNVLNIFSYVCKIIILYLMFINNWIFLPIIILIASFINLIVYLLLIKKMKS